MLKKLLAALAISMIAMTAQSADYGAPKPYFHDPVDQHLYKNGVSFVRDHIRGRYGIVPGGPEQKLVPGYDTAKNVCDKVSGIGKVNSVTVYAPGGVNSASCK